VIDHAVDDLTITVEAGLPLVDLQRLLAAQGQWLPVDWPRGGEPTTTDRSDDDGQERLAGSSPAGSPVACANGTSASATKSSGLGCCAVMEQPQKPAVALSKMWLVTT